MRRLPVLLMIGLALALAACGGDDETASNESSPVPTAEIATDAGDVEAWCLAYTSLAVPMDEDPEAATNGILARAQESAAVAPTEIAAEMQVFLSLTTEFFEAMVELDYDRDAVLAERAEQLAASPEQEADLAKVERFKEEHCFGR